jgi:hypothetical protein
MPMTCQPVVLSKIKLADSQTALSTSWRSFGASSTDFAGRGAPRPDVNTLPTWTRKGSAKPLSW